MLLVVAAAVSFSPDPVLGVLTQGVQALAGVLLPSATVFLVLLCNDKAVLGPWVNSTRQNIVAGVIVWVLVLLSLSLTAATFFPDLTTTQLKVFFVVGAGVGLLGGLFVSLAKSRAEHAAASAVAAELGGLDPDQVQDLDSMPRDRVLRRDIQWQERESWRTPALETLERPAWSPLRTAGMIALRGYLVVAVLLVGVKVAQTIIG
ncbi:putative natural resistance-associated macrophage protein [Mycobacteroides abscessus MAB_030201_1075]|nr:putative natural resistance-associated macrophage protein [Mycobacteroides abscessus MAB_030201_1075]